MVNIFFPQRSFPAIYSNRTRTKRKAPEPPRVTKFLELQFCLQEENTNRSPKDETLLLRAGLGRRSINISDDADHSEVSSERLLKVNNIFPNVVCITKVHLPLSHNGCLFN